MLPFFNDITSAINTELADQGFAYELPAEFDWALVVLAIIWTVGILQMFGLVATTGLRPREIDRLPHIVTAQLKHVGLHHIVANSAALAVLVTWFVAKVDNPFARMLVLFLAGGVLVWLFASTGRESVGSSIFGYGLLGWLFVYSVSGRLADGHLITALVIGAGFAHFVVPSMSPEALGGQGHFWGFVAGCGLALSVEAGKAPAWF